MNKESISHKIAVEAMQWCGFFQIQKIASLIGVSGPGLGYNVRGIKKWSVETWLYFLTAMGVVVFEDDKIIILTDYGKELKNKTKNLNELEFDKSMKGTEVV